MIPNEPGVLPGQARTPFALASCDGGHALHTGEGLRAQPSNLTAHREAAWAHTTAGLNSFGAHALGELALGQFYARQADAAALHAEVR